MHTFCSAPNLVNQVILFPLLGNHVAMSVIIGYPGETVETLLNFGFHSKNGAGRRLHELSDAIPRYRTFRSREKIRLENERGLGPL